MSAPEHGKHNCHSIRAPDLTVFWVAHATGAASLSTVHAICAPLFATHRGGSVAVAEIVAGLFAWIRARDASIATLECGPAADLCRIALSQNWLRGFTPRSYIRAKAGALRWQTVAIDVGTATHIELSHPLVVVEPGENVGPETGSVTARQHSEHGHRAVGVPP